MVFKTYLRLQVWRHFGYLPAKFQEVYVKFDGVKHACFNPHDQLNQKGAKNAGYIRDSSFQVLPRSKLCLKNDHSHDISLVSYFLIDWLFDLIWFDSFDWLNIGKKLGLCQVSSTFHSGWFG